MIELVLELQQRREEAQLDALELEELLAYPTLRALEIEDVLDVAIQQQRRDDLAEEALVLLVADDHQLKQLREVMQAG